MIQTHHIECPGCGHDRLTAPCRIARQPVVLNYRFHTAAAALRVRRKDIQLVQCGVCGLIFNAAFDASLVPYDANYENRQCFSPAFQEHLTELADDLIGRYALRGKRLLEVGCGKGDFLRLICERAAADGAGYDTSYEGPARQMGGRVRFFKRYVGTADITRPFDALICRHVVEHIGEIGSFLNELRNIAAACGNPVTVIETPSFEWIARHRCFWDVFYEHCNYFTLPCLAYLCERAGFTVVGQRLVFGGQYQVLELRVRRAVRVVPRPRKSKVRLAEFVRRAEAQILTLEKKLPRAGAQRGWAVWGGGAKGVALVTRLRRYPPRFVIDTNKAKQGCFIAGSRVPVVSPDDPRIRELALVLIANPNYTREITSTLRANGYAHTIRTI